MRFGRWDLSFQQMIAEGEASVIDGVRGMVVEFKRYIDRVESSGADDGSAVLEPGNANDAVARGGIHTVAPTLMLVYNQSLLQESSYERQPHQDIRFPVTVRC